MKLHRILFGFLILFGVIATAFRNSGKPTPYEFSISPYFPTMPISAINTVTIEGAELGRHLFYDPILSQDLSFSCANCHRQRNAFSDSPNKFSAGINGENMSRNTLPLFNLAWYNSFFWDGRASSIENQVFEPVRAHNEMNLDWQLAAKRINSSKKYRKMFRKAFGFEPIDSTLIAYAIAQFERTLISATSKFDRVLNKKEYLSADEYEGFVLMNDQTKGDCLHCHTTDANALGTIVGFSNNGLEKYFQEKEYRDKGRAAITGKAMDVGKFKIPSLRNLVFTAPYMHDGRFNTIEEVIDFYSENVSLSFNIDSKMQYAHQGGVRLSAKEKSQIVAFLLTLSDSSFVSNPKFSNPYKQ